MSAHFSGGIALSEKATEIPFSGESSFRRRRLSSLERLLKISTRIVHGGDFPGFSGQRYRQLITDWLNEKQKTI